MEIRSVSNRPGNNVNDWCSNSLDRGHIQISGYQSYYQAGMSLNQPGFEGDNLPTYCVQSSGDSALCVSGQTVGYGYSAFVSADRIMTIPVGSEETAKFHNGGIRGSPGSKEKGEKSGFRDSLSLLWRANSKLEIPPSGTRGFFGGFTHDNSISMPSYELRHQDWVTGVANLPDCLDQDEFADTITTKHRTSYSENPLEVNLEHEDIRAVAWPSRGSPKPSSLSPGVMVEFSSSFDPYISSSAMAHQAVADLFPELVEACGNLGMDGAPHYEEISGEENLVGLSFHEEKSLTSSSHSGDAGYRSMELRRDTHSVMGTFEEEKPLLESSASIEPLSSEVEEDMPEGMKRQRSFGSQTAFITSPAVLFAASRESPKIEKLSQLCHELAQLDPKTPDYRDFIGAEGNVSSSMETVSPRYLSKHHSSSVSLELGFPQFEERNCGGITHEVSKGMLCEGPVVTKQEDEDEGEDEVMFDALSIKSESKSPRPEGSKCIFSLPSSAESPPPPPPPAPSVLAENSSSLSTPAAESGLADSVVLPGHRDASRCSPPEESNCSFRLKSKSKGGSRSRVVKKSSKEVLKEQNQLLLRWRAQGISYKIIKERLGIDEAESTLRGRLRTLTKPKNQRLRRPEWMEEDILLLLETVDPEVVNVKWKWVSEAIVRLGGSYKFGPSTCKKKYMMLVEEGRAQPLAENPAVIKGSTIKLEIGNSRC